jgi:virginiamycin B lyase
LSFTNGYKEDVMTRLPYLGFFVFVLLAGVACSVCAAQTDAVPALTGLVMSVEEGRMEGVLVSAKKAGSSISITVVSDEQGRYRFPQAKLEPGAYALAIRAVGYDLDGPSRVEVAQGSSADLKLRKAKDIAAQLSNAEWIASMPGTQQQKATLLNCVSCHTAERIVRSHHDTDAFIQTLKRMSTYANQSTPLQPQLRRATRDLELIGEDRARVQKDQAEWLATVNLGSREDWSYTLKPYPRPKGRATRVVITQYDLPRQTIEPHDVVVLDGMAWYCDFGAQAIGKLDPRTGKITEYPLPELKKGWPLGSLSLRNDKDGNLWLGMMYQAAVAKFDRRTEKFQIWQLPPEWNRDNTQVNMTSPFHYAVDGKVWTQNNGFAGVHRLDLASGKFETWEPFKGSKRLHNIYDVIADSRNNAWFTDIANEHIGRIDASTGKITLYTTPTSRSGPRRGMMDAQDRLWFAQYRGNKIAMFDTKTEQFTEWPMKTPWLSPYDVAIDRNGEAWTGSMLSDQVARLNTKTGEAVEYLLPRSTNVRRVFVDNSTTPVTFWVGSNHGASIIKLEPLD